MGSRAAIPLVALCFALLCGCAAVTPVGDRPVAGARVTASAAAPSRAEAVWAAATSQPVVALTFDDGPDPRWTPSIVETLRRDRVTATFFVLGSFARQRPELIRLEHRSGEQIACHGWNHKVELGWTRSYVVRTFDACASIVQRTAGIRTRFVRPPYGLLRPDQVAALERSRFTVVDWSLSVSPSVVNPALLSAQLARVRSGTIILLHDGRGNRSGVVRLLPKLIDDLRARGFRMVTVSDLLGADAARLLEPASVRCRRVDFYASRGFVPRTVLAGLTCANHRHIRAA